MATIAAPSASIKQPPSAILSHQNSPPPKSQPFRFTTTHHHALSYSTLPKTPLAISEKTSASSVNSSSSNKPTKPIIVIDNYDSFTYNLCQYLGELGCEFEVYRNDELTVDELKERGALPTELYASSIFFFNRFLFRSDSSFPNAAYNSMLYCALQVCL